jgi:hypothetical protein
VFFSNIQQLVDTINQDGIINDVLELEDSFWKQAYLGLHNGFEVTEDSCPNSFEFCNKLDDLIVECINVDHARAEAIVKFMFLIFGALMPSYEICLDDYVTTEKRLIDSYIDDLLELHDNE